MEDTFATGSSENHLITPTEIFSVVPSLGSTWVVARSANTKHTTKIHTIAETTSLEAAQAVIRLMGVEGPSPRSEFTSQNNERVFNLFPQPRLFEVQLDSSRHSEHRDPLLKAVNRQVVGVVGVDSSGNFYLTNYPVQAPNSDFAHNGQLLLMSKDGIFIP